MEPGGVIAPITVERWQEAQAAELMAVSYDNPKCALHSYALIFNYLGMAFDQHGKQIIEVGCGGLPAVSFCTNVYALVVEPLWFANLKKLALEGAIQWIRQPFEDWDAVTCDEVWLFNVLQHVREPEVIVERARQIAPTIRFFEPVDYGTCVYHPHTFSQNDFVRWFGGCVKRYTDRLEGFFDADCVYGTWQCE